ncbi:hypothetical protein GCM10011382_13490 [Vreelandella lutescens]|uniref:Uncharacterized protein n=1 Tax=Vreelandella lutescens TaxID=1602943 RepID=A0ABQ1NWP9_9GAMM|nr:hypothetical protein GCM10011382_13490 [Halomonas lutescens]
MVNAYEVGIEDLSGIAVPYRVFLIQWLKCDATAHKIQDNRGNLEFYVSLINIITFYILRNYCVFQE